MPFADYLVTANPDQKIAIIKYARGGSSIANNASRFGNWSVGFSDGNAINQYDNFLTTVKNALAVSDIDGDGSPDTLVPKGIIWMQGEADACLDWAANDYYHNLTELMGLIRAAFHKDDIPVVLGQIADSGGDPKDGKMMDFIEIVHQAQQNFAKQDKAATLVNNPLSYQFLKDNWHYKSENYIDLGQAFAKAILKLNQD
ncbi:sialate O-acetylesterase [Catenovulum sp. 2E275]|uniref:sialate O-acetylesterase n=1 Tax=Catenovulum sp. 2E275 TaxID=2980497 RepID=UPI0021CFD1CB|nr:sialate O-acetylesterase [Catenovulum sp. 2E275]MCU4675965.1 sialate O-acetylesterase [Catenovulum sp. 2E275]